MRHRLATIWLLALGLTFALTGGARHAHVEADHPCCHHHEACHDADADQGTPADTPPAKNGHDHHDCAVCALLAGLTPIQQPLTSIMPMSAPVIWACTLARAQAHTFDVRPWSARGPPARTAIARA